MGFPSEVVPWRAIILLKRAMLDGREGWRWVERSESQVPSKQRIRRFGILQTGGGKGGTWEKKGDGTTKVSITGKAERKAAGKEIEDVGLVDEES